MSARSLLFWLFFASAGLLAATALYRRFVDLDSYLPTPVRAEFYDKAALARALAPLGCPDKNAMGAVVMDADCARLWQRYPGQFCEIGSFQCRGTKFICGSDGQAELCKIDRR